MDYIGFSPPMSSFWHPMSGELTEIENQNTNDLPLQADFSLASFETNNETNQKAFDNVGGSAGHPPTIEEQADEDGYNRRKCHDYRGTEEQCTPKETLDLLQTNFEAPKLKSTQVDAEVSNDNFQNRDVTNFISKIHEVLRFACQKHGLPLAQTWVPHGFSPSDQDFNNNNKNKNDRGRYSILPSAFYAGNIPEIQCFHYSCLYNLLLKGQGIVGNAFLNNKPSFSTDVFYCRGKCRLEEFALSSMANFLGLHGAIAIPAYFNASNPPGDRTTPDYVLELFLPRNCRDVEEQKTIVISLVSSIAERLPIAAELDFEQESGSRQGSDARPIPRSATNITEVQQSTGTDDVLFLAKKNLHPNNEEYLETTPNIRHAVAPDAATYRQGSFSRVTENETRDLPAGSPRDANKSTTGGTSNGSSRGKRDPIWKFCSSLAGNSHGVKCHFCDLEIKGGGITRFKLHLASNDPSKNVKKCQAVPDEVKVEVEEWLKTKDKKRKLQ